MRGRRRIRPGRHSTLRMFFVLAAAVLLVLLLRGPVEKLIDFVSRSSAYDPLIIAAARRNGIDPRLVKAVIWRESAFDRNARGKAGEIGLMQVIPEMAAADWARAHHMSVPSRAALANPELNIEIGTWYLARSLYRWRNYKDRIRLALCEYNAGPVRARAWRPPEYSGDVMSRITIPSTRSYVDSIMNRYDYYKLHFMTQNTNPKGKQLP